MISIPKACVHAPRCRDEGVIDRDEPLLVSGAGDLYITKHSALHHDQAVRFPLFQEFHRVMTELGGEHAIPSGRGASSLDMTQDDIAGFDLRAFFNLRREPFRDPSQTDRFWRVLDDPIDNLLSALWFGAFGDSDDGESLAALRSPNAVFRDFVDVETNLRDQDDVRSARDPCVERDPSRVASHELDNHDTMVTRGCRVNAIERFCCDMDSGLESECDVCAVEIVVDGLWDPDAVESLVGDLFRDGHGAIASDDDQCIDFADLKVRHADIGEIFEDCVPLLILPDWEVLGVGSVVGPDDGAAHCEDVGDIVEIESVDSVFDKSKESVLDSEYFDAVIDRVFGDGADDRVETGTIAASSEDSDAFDFGCRDAFLDGVHVSFRRIQRSRSASARILQVHRRFDPIPGSRCGIWR